jgi:hypothetical protein
MSLAQNAWIEKRHSQSKRACSPGAVCAIEAKLGIEEGEVPKVS